jgi:hypothetical protein
VSMFLGVDDDRWMTPAEGTSAHEADRVEVFSIRERKIVPAEGWPALFWSHVEGRHFVSELEVKQIVGLFCELESGISARCHNPAWGLAFYKGEELLLTATLCFYCSNAYIYTKKGKDLRAFDKKGEMAVALMDLLKRITNLEE